MALPPPPPLFAFGLANLPMLGWLAAAAAPIIIHLFSRRRYQEMSWAAMEYLLAAVERHTRRLLFEQWLLLAIRILLIVLVVLAVAGPYHQRADLLFAPDENTHRVLVFDGSFSMAYQPAEQSRFERAKALARQIVEECPQGDAFTLLLMTTPPRVVVGTPAWEPAEMLREIDALELPHTLADLPATMKLLEKHLPRVRRENPRLTRQQVLFLTDLQRVGWSLSLRGAALAEFYRRSAAVAEQAALMILDVGQPAAENLAVTALGVFDLPALEGREIRFEALLKHFGGPAKTRQPVELLIDGHKVQQKYVDFSPGPEAAVAFTYRFTVPGDHAVEIHAPGDALPIDNYRYYVVPVQTALRVLCIDGRPTGQRFRGAAGYVAQALAPQPASAPAPVQVEVASESALSERDLSHYDCVFLCNVAQFTASEARLLSVYLQAGGNLVFFLGDQVIPERYNAEIGFPAKQPAATEAAATRILPARIGRSVPRGQYRLDPRDYRHPLLTSFRGRGEKALLTTPLFQYFKLELPKDSTARVALATNKGDPLVVEETIHRGRVVLVATAADKAWSAVPLWPSFLPLVQEILAFCVAGKAQQHNLRVGQPLSGRLPETTTGTDVELQLPDGRALPLTPQSSRTPLQWRFAPTWLSGIYGVRFGDSAAPRQLFAVNVNTAESNLAALPAEELRNDVWPGIPFTMQTTWQNLDRPGAAPAWAVPAGLQVEFLYGVLALLFVETFLAWRFGHHGS